MRTDEDKEDGESRFQVILLLLIYVPRSIQVCTATKIQFDIK